MAIVSDNAANNNTLIDGIVERAAEKSISLNRQWIRLRCMPHTVHLAALKVSCVSCLSQLFISYVITQLLEGVGAITATDRKTATSRAGNYQDAVTEPLDREHDDATAVGLYDEAEERYDFSSAFNTAGVQIAGEDILSAVEKVRLLFH
jgi:hypothetical protein